MLPQYILPTNLKLLHNSFLLLIKFPDDLKLLEDLSDLRFFFPNPLTEKKKSQIKQSHAKLVVKNDWESHILAERKAHFYGFSGTFVHIFKTLYKISSSCVLVSLISFQ